MLTRRLYKAVVRDIDTHEPCAMYDGKTFVRFEWVDAPTVVAGKGRCYACGFKGKTIMLWQMYDLDRWYIEEAIEDVG